MLELTVNITGKTNGDLVLALGEVLRLVSDEFTSGQNGNEDGDFSFHSIGDNLFAMAE